MGAWRVASLAVCVGCSAATASTWEENAPTGFARGTLRVVMLSD